MRRVAIVGALDMGSSGIRLARFRVDATTAVALCEVAELPKTVGRRGLVRAARATLGEVDAVGVSIAGATDPASGTVRSAGAYPWARGDFAGHLTKRLGVPAEVVNDAEAHLWAHLGVGAHPMICVALGTAVGIAMTDDTGRIRRPRADTNWELGHLGVLAPLEDTAFDLASSAAFALGVRGLEAACRADGDARGTDRFVARVVGFVRDLALTFQPRTVVLAGGVTARLRDRLVAEGDAALAATWPPALPWQAPRITASPHGSGSGLVGAALLAPRSVDA